MKLVVNGSSVDLSRYGSFHEERFRRTLALVERLPGSTVVELGGHPWAMTARLLRHPRIDLKATVSAEEVTAWPDELPVTRSEYHVQIDDVHHDGFVNYSANVERTLFDIGEQVDIVLACEIIEHLTRAPHIMLLNINRWLKPGGRVILTTPNGSQLENPFRVRAKMPAFRYSSYARHNYVFTMAGLVDLVETCGFEVESQQYWSPYRRTGGTRLYKFLAKAPVPYFRNKFSQTIVVVARKTEDRSAASRLPSVYAPSDSWEQLEQ